MCACVRVSVCVIYLFCLILKCYQETLLSALDLRALASVLSTLWLLPSLCARLCKWSLCPASTSCPPHPWTHCCLASITADLAMGVLKGQRWPHYWTAIWFYPQTVWNFVWLSDWLPGFCPIMRLASLWFLKPLSHTLLRAFLSLDQGCLPAALCISAGGLLTFRVSRGATG